MSTVGTSISTIDSPTLRPFPYLPLEVKGYILRFCDPPTLSATSLVSLAFLELSSPILYEAVTITGLKQLTDLVCVEIQHPQPQLQRHLSLSLIRDLTYHHPVVATPSNDAEKVYSRLQEPSRLLRHRRLSLNLDKLHVLVDDRSEYDQRPGMAGEQIEALFLYLTPRSFVFEGVFRNDAIDDPFLSLPLISLASVDHWTRLQEVTFINGIGSRTFAQSGFLTIETKPSVHLSYDFSQMGNNDSSTSWFGNLLEDLQGIDEDEDALHAHEEVEKRLGRIGQVEIVVGTNERRSFVLDGLTGSSILARTTVVVRARI